MALNYIEELLPKTAAYINASNRPGHHNYCIGQKVINSAIPLVDMNQDQLAEFDVDCVSYLTFLDQE